MLSSSQSRTVMIKLLRNVGFAEIDTEVQLVILIEQSGQGWLHAFHLQLQITHLSLLSISVSLS